MLFRSRRTEDYVHFAEETAIFSPYLPDKKLNTTHPGKDHWGNIRSQRVFKGI